MVGISIRGVSGTSRSASCRISFMVLMSVPHAVLSGPQPGELPGAVRNGLRRDGGVKLKIVDQPDIVFESAPREGKVVAVGRWKDRINLMDT